MIKQKKILLILMSLGFFFVTNTLAYIDKGDMFPHPFYLGFKGGGGSTTWVRLVSSKEKQKLAMSFSTPIRVHEGGGIWGFYAGYELIPFFALEATYMHYPNATVFFDSVRSLFSFDHDGLSKFVTHTETVSLSGKFMILIPCTLIRAFSSFGVAGLHRKDIVENRWRATPTFDVGLSYNITDRIMAELAFNYTSGFGESELNPSETFMPFIYSGYLGLAYRIG